jgi:hypothetical protein
MSPVSSCPSCGSAVPRGEGLSTCPACHCSLITPTGVLVPARRDDVDVTIPPETTPDEVVGRATDADQPAAVATLPKQVGRFAVRSKLGEGSFGEVFRAHDPQLDREVALKVAKPETLNNPEREQRFFREARAAANLRHPNIVPLFETGTAAGRHFIASAFVAGRTLKVEIDEADGRPLDFRRAAEVVRRLADALGYAHRQGIVHRDVKPENVLVDGVGEPHVLDFGLAVRAGDEVLKTQAGEVFGTPAYMSPEQAAGRSKEATAASDQYALGVVLYEMLTGSRPFDGPRDVLIYQHVHVEPKRPRTLNRSIPLDLETVCLKCLEKEPSKRYANCEALADDLRRWLGGEPVSARRPGPVERLVKWTRRNPIVAGSLVAVAVSLAVGATVGYLNYREARTQEGIAKTKAFEAERQEGIAQGETKRAKETAIDLAAQLKEVRRILDLSRLREAEVAFENNKVQLARDLLAEIAPENRCVAWRILSR